MKNMGVISNGMAIPNECKCIWCGERMIRTGDTCMGTGINYFTLFCKNCGAIVHHAVNHDNKITGFSVKYKFDETI